MNYLSETSGYSNTYSDSKRSWGTGYKKFRPNLCENVELRGNCKVQRRKNTRGIFHENQLTSLDKVKLILVTHAGGQVPNNPVRWVWEREMLQVFPDLQKTSSNAHVSLLVLTTCKWHELSYLQNASYPDNTSQAVNVH